MLHTCPDVWIDPRQWVERMGFYYSIESRLFQHPVVVGNPWRFWEHQVVESIAQPVEWPRGVVDLMFQAGYEISFPFRDQRRGLSWWRGWQVFDFWLFCGPHRLPLIRQWRIHREAVVSLPPVWCPFHLRNGEKYQLITLQIRQLIIAWPRTPLFERGGEIVRS